LDLIAVGFFSSAKSRQHGLLLCALSGTLANRKRRCPSGVIIQFTQPLKPISPASISLLGPAWLYILHTRAGKKLGFLEKVFIFLGFTVQRRRDAKQWTSDIKPQGLWCSASPVLGA